MSFGEVIERLQTVAETFLVALSGYVPILVVAVVLAAGGWVLARILRGLGLRLISRIDDLLSRRGENRRLPDHLRAWRPYLDVMVSVLFATVFFVFLAAATEALGLPVVTAWITGLSNYLPRLLAGALVLIFGMIGGQIARSAVVAVCASARVSYGEQIGRLVQAAVLLVSGVVVAGQVGLDITFLTVMAGVAGGSVLGGAALAFGIGSREVVGNILAAHYVARAYRIGQVVRIAEIEGRIAEIAATSVVVETDGGRATVPAGRFMREVSVLVKDV